MTRPGLSVVIPTRNRPEFLAEAVDSAFRQTTELLEVIVVDDASDADPGPALARFGDRVRLERLPQRSGANVARNRGIDLARGEMVGFLDDDDLWLPHKTERQLAAMAEGGHAACLCRTESSTRRRSAREVDADWLRRSTPCGTSGLLIRRDLVADMRFDPALPRAQDWDLFVRLVQRGTLGMVPEPLYTRRTGHERITTATPDLTPDDLLAQAAALRKHRDWLGETAYRQRVARLLLAHLPRRRGKARFVAAALRHAGPRAALAELASRLRRHGGAAPETP
ncbi:glycosyltransferase family 2 protein [Histidinibacterium lentulum]|uniref:Glycosyltransferase family 2 protein n=1 Tax=Histidinibacterium lentulum TaxID=2480588 RepID=A0A3N2QS13_9RHOB|nr:glycosyltransferase family A protein [Histidinibacterium lentulum]ROT97996.1 glycosyltransferase family 2 protein [Histidinibacterium lentulum]